MLREGRQGTSRWVAARRASPQCPILLAVDQELGEASALRVAPELADPVVSLEVGEHQDVEQLGAGSRTEGVKALTEPALEPEGLTGHRSRR
jgi:hypothetical protein